MPSHIALPSTVRRLPLALAALALATAGLHAQDTSATRDTLSARAVAAQPDTSAADSLAARAESRARARDRRSFRTHFVFGFVTSILAHEAGHVVASLAVGAHPSFGFNEFRPTIYSGIDASLHPTKQFIFSSAGLTVQSLLDESILDVPHRGGSAFERGILAGGIGTVLFYITLGRNGSVSDVAYMAQTSKLSKDQVSLIYGGIAALHAVRIHGMAKYAHFFTAPSDRGGMKVGMRIDGDFGD
ncbi:MAG TPA: hypothetical protein VIC24_04065 [Gemmatimonadaceae bacterium]